MTTPPPITIANITYSEPTTLVQRLNSLIRRRRNGPDQFNARTGHRRTTFSLPRPSAPYIRLPPDVDEPAPAPYPAIPSPFLDGQFFLPPPLSYHAVIEVDPAERVHFILEGTDDAATTGVDALPGYGRLFIQMDELRMPSVNAANSNSGFGLAAASAAASSAGPNATSLKESASANQQGPMSPYPVPIWEEVARWVKFEEDVEPGSNRWSKPRVATLALHSLLELRSCILNGVIILDMEATHLADIENQLIDALLAANQITTELTEDIRNVLRAPHIPQYLKMSNFRAVASKSHFPNIASFPILVGYHGKLPNSTTNVLTAPANGETLVENEKHSGASHNARSIQHSKTSPGPLSPSQSFAHNPLTSHALGVGNNQSFAHPHGPPLDEQPLKGNLHFMKKLPGNAEAAHVLIGEAEFLTNPIIAFIRFRESAFLGDMTEVPIPSRFIFLLLGPLGHLDRYHEIGRCLATLMSDEVFHDVAYKSKNIQDILAGVDEFLDQVIVLPPGEWDPTIRIQPPLNVPSQHNRITKKSDRNGSEAILPESHSDNLVRTGRFCGGLIDDVKRKWPWYFWSDLTDALNLKCLASFFFLYFACLAPIVTFGGLLGDATGHNLATIESLLSGALCGLTWALFSGQPLIIMGSTGPILVFESIVFTFCRDHGLSYLSFRCCIGLWTAGILLVMVVTDASVLVKYVTRFTEELFASLISLIFVYHAFKNLYHIAEDFPVLRHKPLPSLKLINSTVGKLSGPGSGASSLGFERPLPVLSSMGLPYVSDVFFLSVVLFLGTFMLALIFKSFRNTRYFPILIRTTISDFSVLFAVLIMLGVDYYYGLATPKLHVPSDFRPTSHTRKGWMVNPIGGNPWWTALATFFPALLATILIFLDQQITAVIINRKENLLRKGCGYHLDLLVLSILVVLCSLMGLPWFVAATVLSITHVNSLRKETECSAPGERPKFLGITEQRVTGLLVFTFIGLSVTMTSVLQLIPMPVLYGIFLYMGISSLKGVQFIQRILILFMPQKYQPDYMFLRSVKTYRVHIFTAIQFLSLVALWVIKSNKKISISFPIMVAALVGIRKLMEKFFTYRELQVLDDVMPESEKKRKSIDFKSRKGLDGDVEVGVGGVPSPEINRDETNNYKGNGSVFSSPLLSKSNRPHLTSNTTTTPVSPGGAGPDMLFLKPAVEGLASGPAGESVLKPEPVIIRTATTTALDAMNITREVERTNVWKSVAKEKFIHSASAANFTPSGTAGGIGNNYGSGQGNHHHHHHRKKKHSSSAAAHHDTNNNAEVFEPSDPFKMPLSRNAAGASAPLITINGAGGQLGSKQADSNRAGPNNVLPKLEEEQAHNIALLSLEPGVNQQNQQQQISSSSSCYSLSSQNRLHNNASKHPEKFSIKIGSDEDEENYSTNYNNHKSRNKNKSDPATLSLINADNAENAGKTKVFAIKHKDANKDVTDDLSLNGQHNMDELVPLVDIRDDI